MNTPKMADVIILAKHKRINTHTGETKFCHGTCQTEVPKANFPTNGIRICKKCQAEKNKNKYEAKKKEQQMWNVF